MLACSIIIPVFNRAALTRQCLDALLARPPACSVEIIVVDNGSRDGTAAMLGRYGDRIRVLTHEHNLFFATACNRGADLARGQHLVFLNNDTVPLEGWLDALLDHARAHPAAGLVAAKLLYPNRTVQHAGMAVCQDLQPRLIYVGFPADHPAVCRSRSHQVVSGACNLITRDLFLRAGGFDTAFVNGYEDLDLCLRLGELGYEVHFCHRSVLYHFESVSEGRFRFEDQNSRLLRERWQGRLRPDDLEIYLADGLIRVGYHAMGLEFHVAPELGVVLAPGPDLEAYRLLSRRAQQVNALMRENVLLRATCVSPTLAPVG